MKPMDTKTELKSFFRYGKRIIEMDGHNKTDLFYHTQRDAASKRIQRLFRRYNALNGRAKGAIKGGGASASGAPVSLGPASGAGLDLTRGKQGALEKRIVDCSPGSGIHTVNAIIRDAFMQNHFDHKAAMDALIALKHSKTLTDEDYSKSVFYFSVIDMCQTYSIDINQSLEITIKGSDEKVENHQDFDLEQHEFRMERKHLRKNPESKFVEQLDNAIDIDDYRGPDLYLIDGLIKDFLTKIERKKAGFIQFDFNKYDDPESRFVAWGYGLPQYPDGKSGLPIRLIIAFVNEFVFKDGELRNPWGERLTKAQIAGLVAFPRPMKPPFVRLRIHPDDCVFVDYKGDQPPKNGDTVFAAIRPQEIPVHNKLNTHDLNGSAACYLIHDQAHKEAMKEVEKCFPGVTQHIRTVLDRLGGLHPQPGRVASRFQWNNADMGSPEAGDFITNGAKQRSIPRDALLLLLKGILNDSGVFNTSMHPKYSSSVHFDYVVLFVFEIFKNQADWDKHEIAEKNKFSELFQQLMKDEGMEDIMHITQEYLKIQPEASFLEVYFLIILHITLSEKKCEMSREREGKAFEEVVKEEENKIFFTWIRTHGESYFQFRPVIGERFDQAGIFMKTPSGEYQSINKLFDEEHSRISKIGKVQRNLNEVLIFEGKPPAFKGAEAGTDERIDRFTGSRFI
jgi:hypothetical protein